MSKGKNGASFRGTATIAVSTVFDEETRTVLKATYNALRGDLSGIPEEKRARAEADLKESVGNVKVFMRGIESFDDFLIRLGTIFIRRSLQELGQSLAKGKEARFGDISVTLKGVKPERCESQCDACGGDFPCAPRGECGGWR